ncbi:MAG: sulfurtransferase-like selenium metabolism protein YedF, partial [Proteobacteria bacterium]|nr:sulfurtransferase-like selenium metabolism protein YedF [Pseudomonadota bacterium]
MTRTLDCTNLQCPAPVIETKKYLERETVHEVNILVDNDAAMENVSRFLSSQGFEVTVDSNGITSTVSGKRDQKDIPPSVPDSLPGPDQKKRHDHQKIMIMLSSEQIGKGDPDLGKSLMINFIRTLKEMGNDLWRIVMVN